MLVNKYILILGLLFIVIGCASEPVVIPEVEIQDECIELGALDIFGIDLTEITNQENQCETCSPWYSPIIANFKIDLLDQNGDQYELFYSNNCARHEASVIKTCVRGIENSSLLPTMRDQICNNLEKYSGDPSECEAGFYESVENGMTIIALSKHVSGSPVSQSGPEDNFTGVKKLTIEECQFD
jgi:hypothetical protein